MGVAYFIGEAAATDRDSERRLTATATMDQGVSRSWVSGRVAEQASGKATKVYVDTRDSQFALATYYVNQDKLLMPLSSKGVANGVATLNVSTKIPAAQVPHLGSGMVRGPHGSETTVVAGGSTGSTPIPIATLYTGVSGVTGLLWAYLIVGAQSVGGRPIVEVRVGNSTQTTYASQTLIAAGRGRRYLNSAQLLTVVPVPAALGVSNGGSFASNTNLLVQAWIYDDGGGTTTISSGYIYSTALYFAKTAI